MKKILTAVIASACMISCMAISANAEGEDEGATLLEPEQTTAVVTEPVETTTETETTTTVITTESPKTGQTPYALAAIPVALAAVAILATNKKK